MNRQACGEQNTFLMCEKMTGGQNRVLVITSEVITVMTVDSSGKHRVFLF